jgi:hypothetical protein
LQATAPYSVLGFIAGIGFVVSWHREIAASVL